MTVPKQYLVFCLLALLATAGTAEVIEEIYAVVNGEPITRSEFQNAEREMLADMQDQLKEDGFQEELQKRRRELLDKLIEHKLIVSKAKEKNYSVDNEVEMILSEIKKQNNMKSDDELRRALQAEGITLEEFKTQQKLLRMQQRLIYEEVSSKIEIDNAEIVDYYRKNSQRFTKPVELSLNCIFLNKDYYLSASTLAEKKERILSELQDQEFTTVAANQSDLENPENKAFLGNFKKGELNEKLESAALELETGQHSGWIETENGWYIVQLIGKTEATLQEYKDVREQIKNTLMQQRQEAALEEYLDRLRKESYIKIHIEF